MKKTLLVVTILSVTILALSTVGLAYAQSRTPDFQGFGPGMQSESGMWNRNGEEGPLHEIMITYLASALGLTPEELEARHETGETAYQIALEQGLSEDVAYGLIIQARSEALAQAVSDGLITQEQADWMLQRQASMGTGFGDCDGTGPMGNGGAGHSRFGGDGYRFAPASP